MAKKLIAFAKRIVSLVTLYDFVALLCLQMEFRTKAAVP